MKSRLSIDTQSGRGVDWGTLGVFTRDSIAKVKEGVTFFGDGIKTIVTDVAYAWSLLVKAAQVVTVNVFSQAILDFLNTNLMIN